MKFLLPRVALTSLALGVCTAGYAQDPVPIEFYRPLKNSVSVGVRMIGGNAKVKFGNVGNLPSAFGGITAFGAQYYNASWFSDSQRTAESAADSEFGPGSTTSQTTGTVTTQAWVERIPLAADGSVAPNMASATRYRLVQHSTYADTDNPTTDYALQSIIGEYVNYDPATHTGFTRDWTYNSASQVGGTNGNAYVDMSSYEVRPTGASSSSESDKSTGVELQFAHIIKRYKRFEWGLNFSAGASLINAKTRERFRGSLIKTTDRYRIAPTDSRGTTLGPGSFPFSWYSNFDDARTVTATTTGSGPGFTAQEYSYGSEEAKFLNTTPISTGQVTTQDVDVFGYWQVKGAYYLLRVGPIVRFPVAKNWTITASAGAAGAYVGTKFIIDEYVSLSDVAGDIRYQSLSQKQNIAEEKRFIPGFYADVNIERWLTVRTGFYVGYGYEKLGDYSQNLAGRSAKIDLGSDGGFRFGIITRF